jgi:hypothetical protein
VKSVAGVQFMALAAALVSSIGDRPGAEALQILLESSAVDKTQVPSAGMLRPLLKALEPRCTPLRFLDSVVYCRNLLIQSQESTDSKTFWNGATEFPDANGIAKLVFALSKLKESDPSSKLEIRAGSTAPWVIAFSSWIFGVFPSIAFENQQPLVTSSQNSRLTVLALPRRDMDLEILVFKALGRPSDLIVCEASKFGYGWSGMVSVNAYGKLLRHEFDMSSDDAIRRLTDFLPYAVHQCLTLLRPSKDARSRLHTGHGQHISPDNSHFTFDENLSLLLATPFGQDTNISKAISLMLGLTSEEPPICVKSLPDGVCLHDLPAVRNHLAALERICTCTRCHPAIMTGSYQHCLRESFWRGIAFLVMDILCLSFFENLDELAVSLHQDEGLRHEICTMLVNLLSLGCYHSYNVLDFYDWALALVGHSKMPGRNKSHLEFLRRRILSSTKGQVTYLKLFEKRLIERRGYLTLAWAHGVLRFDNVEYDAAVESTRSFSIMGTLGTRFMYEPPNGLVTGPRNLCSGHSMEWTVTPFNSILELSAVCRGVTDFEDVPVRPFAIVQNLAQSLIMEGCEHHSDALLNKPDVDAVYSGPLFNHRLLDPNDQTSISCVAVDGDNGLRMLAFGGQDPPFGVVFRGDACLACALDVCRKAKFRVLIL